MKERAPSITIVSPFWSLSSIRFQMILLLAFCMAVFGIMRGSMSMAIVDMVRDQINDGNTTVTDEDEYKVDWTVEEQARIHTSFYVGALFAVFSADLLTKRFGAKRLLSLGVALNVLGSFLTPPVVLLFRNYLLVIAIRTAMGIGNGFMIPCGSVLIAKWFPVAEKSTAMAIFTCGNQVGIAVSMLLTAKVCQIPMLGGWPFAFFFYGATGLVFLTLWEIRGADKPRQSNYITATELEYIMGRRARKRANTVVTATPYAKIIFSPCVMAICLCNFATSFVLVGLITYLPRYNQLALHMNLSDNGMSSAVPFVVQIFTKMSFGTIADSLKKRRVSATLVTKISNAIASFGTGLCILGISLCGPETAWVVVLLMCLSMGFFSGFVAGFNTSIVSVAPQYTAFVSSYGQVYAQAASTLAPIIMAAMTSQGTVEEWKYVFYILAAVLFFTGIFFQVFGHGHSERWGESISQNPSIHLNSFSATSDTQRSICLEDINSQLAKEQMPSRKVSRRSRVSYADEEGAPLSSRMALEQLENDCIVEENSE